MGNSTYIGGWLLRFCSAQHWNFANCNSFDTGSDSGLLKKAQNQRVTRHRPNYPFTRENATVYRLCLRALSRGSSKKKHQELLWIPSGQKIQVTRPPSGVMEHRDHVFLAGNILK